MFIPNILCSQLRSCLLLGVAFAMLEVSSIHFTFNFPAFVRFFLPLFTSTGSASTPSSPILEATLGSFPSFLRSLYPLPFSSSHPLPSRRAFLDEGGQLRRSHVLNPSLPSLEEAF